MASDHFSNFLNHQGLELRLVAGHDELSLAFAKVLHYEPSELVADLKNLRRYMAPVARWWSGITPDGSPLFSRDLGTDEIYALDLSLP